mgnify:CR=1 FL=1
MNDGWYWPMPYGEKHSPRAAHYFRKQPMNDWKAVCGRWAYTSLMFSEAARPGDPVCKLCKAKVEKGEIT